MVQALASVGYLGTVPRYGALLCNVFGMALATLLFVSTQSGAVLLVGWSFLFAATAWSLPRALDREDIANESIVIDRMLGIWLAAAPTLPAMPLALNISVASVLGVFFFPILAYHLILIGPLRRMGQSPRAWQRVGDDLIAGGIVVMISVAILALVLRTYGTALPA